MIARILFALAALAAWLLDEPDPNALVAQFDPLTLSLITGGLGAGLGAVGDFFGARQERRELERAGERTFFGVELARAQAERQFQDLLGSPFFAGPASFIGGAFGLPFGGLAPAQSAVPSGFGIPEAIQGTPLESVFRRRARSGPAFLTDPGAVRQAGVPGTTRQGQQDIGFRALGGTGQTRTNVPFTQSIGLGEDGGPVAVADQFPGAGGAFAQPANPFDPLLSQFSNRLRTAQEARGLRRSPAAAQAEAAGLTALQTRLQQELLPTAIGFGQQLASLRGQLFQQELTPTLAQTLGPSAFGINPPQAPSPGLGALSGGISGLFSGLQLGQTLGGSGGLFGRR